LEYQTECDVKLNAFLTPNPGPTIIHSRMFKECRICDLLLIGYVDIHTEDSQKFHLQTQLTCVQ